MSNYDDTDDRESKQPGQGGPGRSPQFKPNGVGGGLFVWILIFGFLILGVFLLVRQAQKAKQQTIKVSEFYSQLDNMDSVLIRRNMVTGKYRTPVKADADVAYEEFALRIREPEGDRISETLKAYNDSHETRIAYDDEPGNEVTQFFLFNLLPVLLILFVLWYLLSRQFRQAGGAGGVLSFGKARARLHTKEQSDITFDQVAGVQEAKEEVQELVEFLKNPAKFRRLGGRIPRGLLLIGPPGCGKTLLAKAIAGEAEVPFFSMSGSDFIEMFVGVGASRVRDLFRQAKESAPCIIFLDEIDAVGRRRAIDLHGASAEGAQTLNAILVEMDGFATDDHVIVIAATNRPDVLDPALLRPGRFDRQVYVELPDIRGREAILKVHARRYKLSPDVDLRQIARGTSTFSGADLEALLNEAAIIATRKGKKAVDMCDLEESRDKVRWGQQRRSHVMTDEDRKITAYHESGHAIVSKLLPQAEPLHKVSIIPQGRALGMTMSLPERDRYHYLRKEMLAHLCMLLAGRVAEDMFCDDITTGAENDLARATEIARNMVCRWGMSDQVGPVSYHEDEDPMMVQHERARYRTHSEAMAVKIDDEVSRLIRDAFEQARTIMDANRNALERMAIALLKYEVLYVADVDNILAGKEVDRTNAVNDVEADEEPDRGDTSVKREGGA